MVRAAAFPLVGLLLSAVLHGASQIPTFRTEIDLVSFGVTVTDRQGQLVTDLTADDFEIVEEGARQEVTFFARGDRDASAPELHVGLLLDTSGSMRSDLELTQSAAIRFLGVLTEAKEMTLVEFDSTVRLGRFAPDNFPRLVERIRSIRPGGFTALYDALGLYLDGASGTEGRHVLVLYTDGGDTSSAIPLRDLMAVVLASDVTIYAVGLFGNLPMAARMQPRALLHQIAEASGGEAFFPTAMRDVEAAYDRIAAHVRSQYTVGYVSTDGRQDGAWRRVEIRLTRPDLRDARILARQGYFAPYRAP